MDFMIRSVFAIADCFEMDGHIHTLYEDCYQRNIHRLDDIRIFDSIVI